MADAFKPTPILADSHAHLIDQYDIGYITDKILKRAHQQNVKIIIDGGGIPLNQLSENKLQTLPENFYICSGIHPHIATEKTDDLLNAYKEKASELPIVGIGETGLDYHYDNSPRDAQKKSFSGHIEIAKELDLPLVIHCREAFIDCFEILSNQNPLNIDLLFHCFTGTKSELQSVGEFGGYISLGGIITFNGAEELREAVVDFPLERILLETDSPYLSPEPKRGKVNEPSNLPFIAEKLGEIKGLEYEDIAYLTTLNTRKFFNLTYNNGDTFTYQLGNKLYLNITNRCTNRCSFCIRNFSDGIANYDLRLDVEPLIEEMKEEISNPGDYEEIVFCGYGEPLLRPKFVSEVAKWIKKSGGRVRVNTNGCANLYCGYDVLDNILPHIDRLSVSLNAPDEETYKRICRPKISEAYEEVLSTIKKGVSSGIEVEATMVDLPSLNSRDVEKVAEKLGVKLRVRGY